VHLLFLALSTGYEPLERERERGRLGAKQRGEQERGVHLLSLALSLAVE